MLSYIIHVKKRALEDIVNVKNSKNAPWGKGRQPHALKKRDADGTRDAGHGAVQGLTQSASTSAGPGHGP